ncbi:MULTISPECIES: hypothetical protein [Streptomyces]|uniref:hypothetical protein n=1 Tax=Streptomyces TaxID=1883 RepID=UPI000A6C2035|nr:MULTISPECIES: hypothetical protein [Streptomyces]MCL7365367.1 nucleic acid/nucleotide deaminase domain-containing protein [Streptomyces ardesiacus]
MRAHDLPEALGKETRKGAPAVGRPAIGRPELQPGHPSAPSAALALQRAIGNTATTRVVEESRHRHGAGSGHGRTGAGAAASGTPTVQRAPAPGGAGPKEEAKPTEWFNATTGKWQGGQPDPETMRPAHGGERLLLKPKLEAEYAAKHYTDVGQVPVFKARAYRRKKGPGPASTGRSPELRMLDRLGRLGMSQIRPEGTPHLATSVMPNGRLGIAGNTGRSHVTGAERDNVNQELADVQDESVEPYGQRRMDKDLHKVRAMQAGDYFEGAYNRPQLGAVAKALKNPDWSGSGVGDNNGGQPGSQHGEMTLLGQHIADWKANPRQREQGMKTVDMGGVKLACAACQWAFEAANQFIGSKYGYRVAASGGHGMLFRNWIMPKWLAEVPEARKYVESKIKAKAPGARFYEGSSGALVLYLPKDYKSADADQDPAESESEWEPI